MFANVCCFVLWKYLLDFLKHFPWCFLQSITVIRIISHFREFQKISTQLLNQCCLSNEVFSSKLLTYELNNWGDTTCLSLAVSSGHEAFVAHSCCQELLSDMWSGAMSFRTQQSLKVTFLYLILLGVLDQFKRDAQLICKQNLHCLVCLNTLLSPIILLYDTFISH